MKTINTNMVPIVVKLHNHLALSFDKAEEINDFFLSANLLRWRQLQKRFPGIYINKLFTTLPLNRVAELIKKGKAADEKYNPPCLNSYFAVGCPVEINAEKILKILRDCDDAELAYIEIGPMAPPFVRPPRNPLSCLQAYLQSSPTGIDAYFAQKVKGGDGTGIKFIDIEQGWMLNHEDFKVNTLPCTGIISKRFRSHGAAVLGVIKMQDNELGGIGIAPNADGYVISQWRPGGILNTADAILAAIDHLNFGDILLLEAQTFSSRTGTKAWPIEIQEATFEVIRLASALGIIVIEAGGNGNYKGNRGNDLDMYVDRKGKKILNRCSPDFRDSGAILVAAASSCIRHKKMSFSNYGNRIDCFAWGENVVSAGHFPKTTSHGFKSYTNDFCGTSSASAILAGAAIVVQSITEAKYHHRHGPKQMRQILSNELLGTNSLNGRNKDKIGVMPDLRKITHDALGLSNT